MTKMLNRNTGRHSVGLAETACYDAPSFMEQKFIKMRAVSALTNAA